MKEYVKMTIVERFIYSTGKTQSTMIVWDEERSQFKAYTQKHMKVQSLRAEVKDQTESQYIQDSKLS